MFQMSWSEVLIVVVVAIVVVGPKDLPRMLRGLGRRMAKLRRMAGEFRSQFDEALRQAELEEVRSSIESVGASRASAPAQDPRERSERAATGSGSTSTSA